MSVKDSGELVALALRYIQARRGTGHLNRRSAEQVRYRLLSFADSAAVPAKKVTRKHVDRWLDRPDYAPLYQRSRLSALRGFCRWCVAEGHMRIDPTLGVELPHVPPQLPKRLTADEARTLVAWSRRDPRTYLIVVWMLQLGLRRIELARLRVEDIDFAERTVSVRGKGGRGEQTDTLPITAEAWRALQRYLAVRPHAHGPLVLSNRAEHQGVGAATISEIVRQAMIESGVKRTGDPTRTPHSTRHSFAHDVLARTSDIRSVQQALRHRSVRSSEVYLRGQVGDLRQVMEGRSYTDETEVPGQGRLLA